MPLFCCINIILFFISCYSDSKVRFIEQDVRAFDVGFVANFRYRGVLLDRDTGRQLFYFSDPVTKKLIKFFNAEGIMEFEVPLHAALLEMAQIEGIEVGSPDTILLFEPHTNRIVFINRTGTIWRLLDLDDYIQSYQGAVYEYRPSFSDRSLFGSRLILKADYISNSKDLNPRDLSEFFSISIRQPYILKVEDIFQIDAGGISFGAVGFYDRFMDDQYAMSELGTFANFDHSTHVYSIFSDTLYIFDDSMALMKMLHVTCAGETLRSKPFELKKGRAEYMDYLERIKYEGHITKSFELDDEQGYMVVVTQTNREKSVDGNGATYVFYDIEGHRLGEVKLDAKRFRPGIIYYFKGSFYVDGIPRKPNNNEKTSCHVFKIAL